MSSLLKIQKKDFPHLDKLYNTIKADLNAVEEDLRVITQSPNRLISEIGAYLFQKGGKRIRPAILVLCSKLLGYRGQEHIRMSSIVEIIHTASLIHDDIIDNSDLRRGKESVHTRWGPNITVLLGDYLYIESIHLANQSEYGQVVHILTEISRKMIEGELEEYYMSGNLDLSEKEYLEIINKKTASLFSCCCQIGGILGRASTEQEKYLVDYGTSLGMCFQIIDDLLDFNSDEKTLGKPVLSDLTEGRITLPLIYTLNNGGGGRSSRGQVIRLIEQTLAGNDSKGEILDILRSNGSMDYTYQKALQFSNKSKAIIRHFPKSIHQEALSLLPDLILNRKK